MNDVTQTGDVDRVRRTRGQEWHNKQKGSGRLTTP
jgi:hypothetical protein